MPNKKPWFLKSKKLGDYSHLRWKDFNELRETVSEERQAAKLQKQLAEIHEAKSHSSEWSKKAAK